MTGGGRAGAAVLALGLVLAAAGGARAAAPEGDEVPTTVTLGGQVRLRLEYRDPLAGDGTGGDMAIWQRARAAVRVASRRVQGVVELQDARLWGGEASTLSSEGNIDLHQAYIRLPDLAAPGLSLTLGRQELSYGDQRLLGALDWSTAGRSFDAGLVRFERGRGAVDVLAALVSDRRTAQRGQGDMVLSGVYAQPLRGGPLELDAYVIHLADGASSTGERDMTGNTRITTVGGRFRRGRASGWFVGGEGAVQTGHRGPDAHRANAIALQAGHAWAGPRTPALRVEWDTATGDGAEDGRSREFHNLFPTNHPHYGYADLLGWRNMTAWRVTASASPFAGHVLAVDGHRLRLREASGAWKDAGGAVLGRDATGAAGREIGQELDLTYRLPVRKDLALLLGYSAFFPGRFARAVRGSETQSFAYVQMLLKF